MKTCALLLPASIVALAVNLATPAARAQQACQAIAERVRSSEPPATEEVPWLSPTEMLDRQPDAVLHLDEGKFSAPKDAREWLKGSLRASPRLLDAVTKLTEGSERVRLHRFGASSLRAVEVNQGSAGCQYFVFFATPTDGPAEEVEAPPILRNLKDGDVPICSGFGGLAAVGEVRGTPVFIVEKGRDLQEKITITPWRDGTWQKSCELTLNFHAVLSASERFCAKGLDCGKAVEEATTLVERYDKDANAFADDTLVDARLRALKARAAERPVGSRDFPTFEQEAKYTAAVFSETTVIQPIMLGDQAYIAKIGHGSIGWRTYPDFLVGLYRLVDDDFEAVAGVIVTKKRSKPIDMSIK